jgi:hypothetical protein
MKIKIDLSKIDKTRIQTYERQDGTVSKFYEIEAIELKEKKEVASGDTWRLVETHFVTNAPTKEERANKVKMTALGRITQFEDKKSTTAEEIKRDIRNTLNTNDEEEMTSQELADSIPF